MALRAENHRFCMARFNRAANMILFSSCWGDRIGEPICHRSPGF